MELILWRHAEAEEGDDDLERALTRRGLKQAAVMADWLRERLPDGVRLVASRARRSQQTLAALSNRFHIDARADPGGTVADLLSAGNWPADADTPDCVVLVGHQPTLGRAAAQLLAGAEQDWAVKKGAVWWFSGRQRAGQAQVVLRAVIGPEQLL
jgi:phosphohistidine phosphatase